jgi:hypothetical protein
MSAVAWCLGGLYVYLCIIAVFLSTYHPYHSSVFEDFMNVSCIISICVCAFMRVSACVRERGLHKYLQYCSSIFHYFMSAVS